MTTPSTSFWTEPQATDEAGCTPPEFEEIERIVTRGSTTGREFRATRFAVGDWLLAKYGPPSKPGSVYATEAQLDALTARLKLSPNTLRKCRLLAHRWKPQHRQPVLDSKVYVSFTTMYQVALSSEPGAFDQEQFEEKVEVLLGLMALAEQHDVLEVTEPDYLKAMRKAIRPSRRPGAESERRAVVTAVHQFEAQQPEVREAILGAVKADEDATRAVAIGYLAQRPSLARAVMREDPDLIEAVAQEVAQHEPAAGASDAEPGEAVFRELVQVLGGARPSDELLLAEWRQDFARAISRFNAFVADWYPADKVAANADDDLLRLVTYLADDVAQWAATITNARTPGGLRLVESTTA
ncbi:hypothetical protein [Streptomyces sp. Tu102]|uniref:hypothetical protein n=1 Tax=Streptomyces TaxID=1883 RepID=UPI001BDD3654|nr:hypothetical protein [Streptomyces sp. Tu102]MBT1093539.1 hypothetical protein [Streptomyces sp. Tu102]